MLPPDFPLAVGCEYRINPEMTVGLPVFIGEFEGWSLNVKHGDEKAKIFRPVNKILGLSPNQKVILFDHEIRDIEAL